MARGLTRHELRQDGFANAARRTQIWVQDHTYLTVGIAVAAVVMVFLITGIVRRQESKTREMETAFARSAIDFGRGNLPTAALAYENFLARFPGSRWAADAALRAANAHFLVGHVDDARDLYDRFLDDYRGDPYMDRAARHGLAACHEQYGDFAAAASIYEELAEAAPSGAERAYQLRAASRCREALGDWEAAHDLLEQASTAIPSLGPDQLLLQHLRELAARQHLRRWQLETLPSR